MVSNYCQSFEAVLIYKIKLQKMFPMFEKLIEIMQITLDTYLLFTCCGRYKNGYRYPVSAMIPF